MRRDDVRLAISLMAWAAYLSIGAVMLFGVAVLAGGDFGGLWLLCGGLLSLPPVVVVIGLCRMFCDLHEHFIPDREPPLRPLSPRQAQEMQKKADAAKDQRTVQHLRKLGKPIDE